MDVGNAIIRNTNMEPILAKLMELIMEKVLRPHARP